jgi:hypothetical protein
LPFERCCAIQIIRHQARSWCIVFAFMNKSFIRRHARRGDALLISICVFVLAGGMLAAAQDSSPTVQPEDLVSAPQRYWARAILFKDTLTSAVSERGVRINDKTCYPFVTRTVGTCYATEEAAAAIRSLDLYRAYAFNAMVVQHRARYYIIVSGATPTADAVQMVKDLQSLSPAMDAASSEAALKPIAEIVWDVQSAHLAYAQEKRIPLCELYDPRSVHFPRAMELVRAAIMKREVEQRAVSSEILAQYLLLALARTCAATNAAPASSPSEPQHIASALPMAAASSVAAEPSAQAPASEAPTQLDTAVKPTPVEQVEPEASAVTTEAGQQESSVEQEPKLSFWQRWKAQQEQRRLEAARAAEEQARVLQEAREREEAEAAARTKEKRQQEEVLAAERQRLAEEKKRAKEEVRRKREEQKAAAARAKEEALAAERARETEAAASKAAQAQAEEERQALEKASRQKEELERAQREREAAEAAWRQQEQTQRQTDIDYASQRQRMVEEQRAMKEAARRQEEQAQRAADMAAAETQRRATKADDSAAVEASTEGATETQTGTTFVVGTIQGAPPARARGSGKTMESMGRVSEARGRACPRRKRSPSPRARTAS